MKKGIANSSSEYQKLFHDFAKITNVSNQDGFVLYENNQAGSIVSYGQPETIQCGIGDYVVDSDFSIEYHYGTRFLHFGIIYEGITYSSKNGELVAQSIPSSFMALEKMDKGVGVWRAGQHFKGVEFSINYDYLVDTLLPSINRQEKELDFIMVNTRYTMISQEIIDVLSKVEGYIKNRILTNALMHACAIELVELLLAPSSRMYFVTSKDRYIRVVKAGKRDIKISGEDINKLNKVRDIIVSSAYDFKTIPMLAGEVGISEQKLKYGFQDYFKQTVWDFQNNIRMSRAAFLIKENKMNFEEISKAVGYHSQTAFYNAFKKWCGLTPGDFKRHLSNHHEN